MELGKNIAALRKERGMTQEQLGQAVGVSAQAVSKWEKGGAPDTEMLPSIADRLGVTIDTLYGRADEPTEDMRVTLLRWLAAIPVEKRMDELFRVLCQLFQLPNYVGNEALSDLFGATQWPVKTCYSVELSGGREEQTWLRSALLLDAGLQLGVTAEDCPMYLLMPEPGGGYEANFADNESYRALFAALALPGALELLRALYAARKHTFFSVEAIAKAAGVDAGAAKTALEAMLTCHLLAKHSVETGETPLEAYELHQNVSFVPFMLFARWLCTSYDSYFGYWETREKPILRQEAAEHEND
ncbi:MAG: helix-turn-helix transcriptional regulator [Ruminococcaceae bacterium]|jgi:transcriptional regulator with XRE-family HTH domain|nr:helix-turn-helix transcriptional regulator [Oscillospiraceae bacterium]